MARPARQIFKIAAQATTEETRQLLIATAKREHGKIMTAEPRPQRFTRFVDGRQGAAEETVTASGRIRYVYDRLDEVVQFALETLFDFSPVLSGEYRKSHLLFVNGVAARNLENYSGGEIVLTNVLPYSRKIELGVMNMRVNGSDQVYLRAANLVASRYGNVARVEFTYRGAVAGGAIGGKKGNQANLRYPALVIEGR